MTAGSGLVADIVVQREGFSLRAAMYLPAGRTVALLGPNGAGKTTAVHALSGLVPLDAGSIALDGVVLDDPERGVFVAARSRSIGVVFQDYVLFPHLSVLENVAFGLRSRGVAKRPARQSALEWLERLDVADLAKRRPGDLSGGQAQRVALARALVTEPRLLLLDEPLAALDVATRAELRHVVAQHLSAYDGARLIITHDPTEAFLLADELHVIEDGVITQSGSADDIRLRPRTPYAADLAGANLLAGDAAHGIVDIDGHRLHIADTSASGHVVTAIHARAIALHRERPHGSPRNTWETTIERLEHHGDRVRVRTGTPVTLTAEVTPDAVRALDLAPGGRVWVSIKATEIVVTAD